jgi:hypothetical protein
VIVGTGDTSELLKRSFSEKLFSYGYSDATVKLRNEFVTPQLAKIEELLQTLVSDTDVPVIWAR